MTVSSTARLGATLREFKAEAILAVGETVILLTLPRHVY